MSSSKDKDGGDNSARNSHAYASTVVLFPQQSGNQTPARIGCRQFNVRWATLAVRNIEVFRKAFSGRCDRRGGVLMQPDLGTRRAAPWPCRRRRTRSGTIKHCHFVAAPVRLRRRCVNLFPRCSSPVAELVAALRSLNRDGMSCNRRTSAASPTDSIRRFSLGVLLQPIKITARNHFESERKCPT